MWLLGCLQESRKSIYTSTPLQEFPNKSLDSFKTNILSKFEKKWAKNVVTRIFSSQELYVVRGVDLSAFGQLHLFSKNNPSVNGLLTSVTCRQAVVANFF